MTQVKSTPVVDRVAFEKLRAIAPGALAARRARQVVRPLPDEVSFKLTNRCNLRCHHCYQWGDDGHHHTLEAEERNRDLDISLVAKVLDATRQRGANVFLWGGEPLFYSHWDDLVALLAEHRRWTSVCTNGVYIEKRLDSLLTISDRLEMFIAVDGFETEHDALRGALSWRRTMKGLRRLVHEREAGNYRGEVTANCVFQDSMVGKLFDFVTFLQDEGVDAVYLSYPWHISPRTAALMDDYVAEHLPSVAARVPRGSGSWHSYTFGLTPSVIGDLRSDLARIDNADWRTKVRYNPEVDDCEPRRVPSRERSAGQRPDSLPVDQQPLRCSSDRRGHYLQAFPRAGRWSTRHVRPRRNLAWTSAGGAAPDRRPARPHARLL